MPTYDQWRQAILASNVPQDIDILSPELFARYQASGQLNPNLLQDPGHPVLGRGGQASENTSNCPDGTRAWGNDLMPGGVQCLPISDPRISGSQATQAGTGKPLPPPKPVTQGAAGTLTYTGNPLTDALLYQFNTQRSLQTGAPNIFTGFAAEGQQPGNLVGRLLQGGGLIWGEGSVPGFAGAPAGASGRKMGRQGLHGGPSSIEQALSVAPVPVAQQGKGDLFGGVGTMPPTTGQMLDNPLAKRLSEQPWMRQKSGLGGRVGMDWLRGGF